MTATTLRGGDRPHVARAARLALPLVYLACVPLANWFVGNVGTTCVPNGPCLVPVGFGLSAPSGVAIAGLALVLRDLVQRTWGASWALCAMLLGSLLSLTTSPTHLVVGSGSAYVLSELADMAIYTPLQRRGLGLAVLASSLAGAVIDSAAFLTLAFGSLDHLAGQVVGKAWSILAATAIILILRRRTRAAPDGLAPRSG